MTSLLLSCLSIIVVVENKDLLIHSVIGLSSVRCSVFKQIHIEMIFLKTVSARRFVLRRYINTYLITNKSDFSQM